MIISGFNGKYTGKITTVSTTNASAQIPEAFKHECGSILITNDTDKTIFIKLGEGAAPTATETGAGITPLKAGLQAIIAKGKNDYVAVVALASATGSVYVTAGN